MASAQGELEEQLVKAGNSLLEPPSSDDELLSLLDQIEHHLSNVEQSPSKSMQTALAPCVKALVANSLLRHPNVDVKVAVATCISEVTRITAPEAPYDDDKMKDIFELIVSSFEDLSDKSSRSYSKRTLILETVAKVRSCVVMLDLECDGLIVKMFQHFLNSIRDYHPENVFTSMETIMSLVLEESEDISIDLISPILSSLKKDNKDFPPIAQKLGERVFESCAKKLKSCLLDAKKSLGLCWDDYSDVVASTCDDLVGENNGETCLKQEVGESKLPNPSSEGEVQADDEKLAESSLQDANKEHMAEESTRETSPEGEGPVVDGSGTSVLSNGISESKTELKLDNVTEASQKLDEGDQGDKSSDANVKSNEADDVDGGKIVASEIKADQTSKKRGRKPKSSTNSAEPSDSSRVDGDKETERLAENTLTEEIHGSPSKDPSHEPTLSSDNEEAKLSPPEELENEAVNADPPSLSGSILDEGRPKRVKSGRSKKKEKPIEAASPTDDGRSKKKEKPVEEASPTDDGRSKKKEKPIQEASPTDDGRSKKKEKSIQEVLPTDDVSEKGAIDSEVKPAKRSGKKAISTGKTSLEKSSPLLDTSSKSKSVATSDSEGKLPEQSGKKTGKKDNTASEPSTKKEEKKKRGRKPASEKLAESSAKDDDKEPLSSPRPVSKDGDVVEETPKVTSKRKRGQGKENDKVTPKPLSKSSKDEDLMEETPKTSSKSNRNKGKEKASDDNIEYGEDLVGSKVQVWWPDDETFYDGVIDSYDPATKKHKVAYSDGEVEILYLKEERWEIIGGDSLSDEEQATGGQSPKSGDPSSDKPKKKKAKTGSQSSKQGKRAEEAPSGRSKRGTPKPGRDSKDETKTDDKPKDKSASKSEADSGLKTKERSKKAGGKSGEASKTAGKSKDVESSTPKSSTKSKEGPAKTATKDTPEAATKSKGKSPKTGLKTDTNGSDKEKSAPAKTKEAEGSKKTLDKGKTPASGKKKSPEDAKSQPSETKSGKKRGRGSRH